MQNPMVGMPYSGSPKMYAAFKLHKNPNVKVKSGTFAYVDVNANPELMVSVDYEEREVDSKCLGVIAPLKTIANEDYDTLQPDSLNIWGEGMINVRAAEEIEVGKDVYVDEQGNATTSENKSIFVYSVGVCMQVGEFFDVDTNENVKGAVVLLAIPNTNNLS